MTTQASTLAADILAHLGQDFSVPPVDLSGPEYATPSKVNNVRYEDIPTQELSDLTTGVVNGTGSFDIIMASINAHLKVQYDKGLISGDQYTKAYVEMTTAALSTGLQFLLQGSTAYWQALAAQSAAQVAEIQAVRASVELETAKYQLVAAAAQAEMLEAQHVLVQMQVSSEDAKYNLANAQIDMVKEQTEAQRAQTMETRSDGTTAVAGLLGKQKALYTQQIDSYKRDAEVKLGRMFVDSWITQKTLDEGLQAPDQFTNNQVNSILAKLRQTHSMT